MATPRSERGGGSDDGGGAPGLGFGLGMEGWSARDDDRRINVYMTCGKPLVWTPEGTAAAFLIVMVGNVFEQEVGWGEVDQQ